MLQSNYVIAISVNDVDQEPYEQNGRKSRMKFQGSEPDPDLAYVNNNIIISEVI